MVKSANALIDLFYILSISLEFISHDTSIHSFQFVHTESRIGKSILIYELFLSQLPLGWYFGIVIKCIQKDQRISHNVNTVQSTLAKWFFKVSRVITKVDQGKLFNDSVDLLALTWKPEL